MQKIRSSAGITLTIAMALNYGWIWLFWGNERMLSLGASLFPVAGTALAFIWLYRAFRKTSGRQKYFWLILSCGIMLYFISNLIWFFAQIFQGATFFTGITFFIWLLACICFLTALIYKTKLLNDSYSSVSSLFNIAIFMILATVVSIHYFMKPALNLPENSLSIMYIAASYQVVDLSLLFVAACVYYLSQHSQERKVLLLVTRGVALQVLADFIYTYQMIMGIYQTGGLIEPLWLAAILLIGLSGRHAEGETVEPNWKIPNPTRSKEAIIPYVCTIVLMILVNISYDWKLNTLSIGMNLTFLLIIVRQISISRKNTFLMQEYRHLAYHDQLTGLTNRAGFQEDLHYTLQIAEHYKQTPAVLIIDLDRFKNVNDTLGHYIGDCILVKAAERLKEALNMNEAVYRVGGDEFVIILPEADENICVTAAETIIAKFSEPFKIADYDIILTPSIGISLYPENGEDSETLLRNADAAMYLAKGTGRNAFRFYNAELNEVMTRKMVIEQELRKAIERQQLQLYYQPKVRLHTKEITGMEALLRWQHPEWGTVSPGEFIPLAEETGQIVSIGEWVIETACKQSKEWHDAGYSYLRTSVNVSVRQFQQADFVPMVKKILNETGMDPRFLEFEITESIMQNIKETTEILLELRKLGIKTSIDDFGTGYSSLHILRNLPIDTIKIDKSFIDDIGDTTKHSMVKTIVDIGLNLQLDVIAEGIEDEAQCRMLIENNCGYGQGYLFARPVPPEEFIQLITKKVPVSRT